MRAVVFDIDTQRDFMEPDGGLYVPGAERIVPALRRVLETARDCGVPVVASMDTHRPDDPEFASFPPHCIAGTHGQEKLPETTIGPFRVVPNLARPIRPRKGETLRLEKTTLSLLETVNFDATLAALRPELAVVVGVATEYCVRATALGLRQRGLDVAVVTDAVRAVDSQAGTRALADVRAVGGRVIPVAEAVRLLHEHGRCAQESQRRRPR